MSSGESCGIVFIQKYHRQFSSSFLNSSRYLSSPKKYDNVIKKAAFMRCYNSNSIERYLSRSGAADKTSLETIKERSYLKEMGMSEKDIISYTKDRPGSTGLFNQDGDMSKDRVAQLRNDLRTTESTIFDTVLSFTPSAARRFCESKLEAYNLLKDAMPEYFKNAGLNPEKMEWFAAFHTNTAHPHCHIVFFEKEPSKVKTTGEAKRLSGYDFSLKQIDKMKELVSFSSPILSKEHMEKRDPIISSAKEIAKTSFKDRLINIQVLLDGKKQYARLNSNQKDEFKDLLYDIRTTNPIFDEAYKDYLKDISTLQKNIFKRYKESGIKTIPQKAKGFAKKSIDEFHLRIYNGLLKEVNYFEIDNDGSVALPKKKVSNCESLIRKKSRSRDYLKKQSFKMSETYKKQSDISKLLALMCYKNKISYAPSSSPAWREIEEDLFKLEQARVYDKMMER